MNLIMSIVGQELIQGVAGAFLPYFPCSALNASLTSTDTEQHHLVNGQMFSMKSHPVTVLQKQPDHEVCI